MPIYFWTPPTTPICLKCLKSIKFSPSWLSREKNHLKVGVYRENFNIGNVAENFFMDFYICWQYAISFSAKFPMLKFSPGAPTLAPPPVPWVFRNLTKKWKWSVLRRKNFFPWILKCFFNIARGTTDPGIDCVSWISSPTKGSPQAKKTVKKRGHCPLWATPPPPKWVKRGHLLSDYRQKCVNATRDLRHFDVKSA